MRRLIGAFSIAAVLVVVLAGPAGAASQGRTVVAHISGGGTAAMQAPGLAGTTLWGAGVTLYSDGTASGGTASGHFDCADQYGSTFPGNIFGEVTSWSPDVGDGLVLNVVGKLVGIPGGHPGDVAFTVKIQQFGGAGVGRWTLEIGGVIYCYEILTSGQIVYRPA